MGGEPDKGTSGGMGVIAMMSHLKSKVLGNSDKSLLKDTVSTDKSALKKYDEVLAEKSVYPSTRELLKKQREAVYNSITDIDVAVESMTAPNH